LYFTFGILNVINIEYKIGSNSKLSVKLSGQLFNHWQKQVWHWVEIREFEPEEITDWIYTRASSLPI